MNVELRARAVSRVFDVLAWVVLGVGGLAAVLVVIGSLFAGDGQTLLVGLVAAVAIVVYSIVQWALVSLGSIVAGYIAARSA